MSFNNEEKNFYEKGNSIADNILFQNNLIHRTNKTVKSNIKTPLLKEHSSNFQKNDFTNILQTNTEYSTSEYLEGMLFETVQRYIEKTTKDKDYIGPVEIKSLFNYLIIVFIITILFYGFLFILTIIQLVIPTFSLNVAFTLVLIFFFISQVIFYLLEFIFIPSSSLAFLSYIILIILFAFYGTIVFLIANGLNVFSIIVTNGSILIFFGLIILLVYLVGIQLEQIKRFSPKLDTNTFIFIGLLFYICFEFINQNRSVLFWIYLAICFCVYFQYADQVVELYRGVSGPYKGLYAIEGILTLTTIIFGEYVLMMLLFYVVKTYGIIIFVFWPPWYYVMPPEWFTWL
jgi:hypothetical protein